MGYNTDLTMFLPIRKGFTKKAVEKAIEAWKKQDIDEHWDDLSVENNVSPKGKMSMLIFVLSEYSRNRIEDIIMELVKFVAPFVRKDSFIEGQGEEKDDLWKVEFDGKGSFKSQNGCIVYGDAYEYFMEAYEKQLPSKLTKELEKWRVAKAI